MVNSNEISLMWASGKSQEESWDHLHMMDNTLTKEYFDGIWERLDAAYESFSKENEDVNISKAN